MRCFIAAERTALDGMWQQLSQDYYIDPDLAMMLVESLGSYLFIRWDLERKDQLRFLELYVEDLMQAALLTHIPQQKLLDCWNSIYHAVRPSLHEFVSQAGKIRGINAILKENQHLQGLVVFT